MAEVAQQAMQQQAEQNKAMAEQNRRTAQAADNLVQAEAKARQDLIQVQEKIVERDAQGRQEFNKLQQDVQRTTTEAQEHVNTERTKLEAERREMARERQQAPIIADAIRGTGLLLGCLLPLLLVVHLLHTLRSGSAQDDALTEILVQDLVAEQPKLFSYQRPAVEALPAPEAEANGDR